MKTIKIGELDVKVCEHKGDILYTRYVKFKQYAPQFWEKMDSPLFEVYWEKFLDFHNQGKHAESLMAMRDYKFAIDNSKNSYDAWGTCFALISGLSEEELKSDISDSKIKENLKLFTQHGLTAEMVKTEVLNFMAASPETFTEHLTLYAIASTTSEMLS